MTPAKGSPMHRPAPRLLCLTLGSIALLASCGGGGGDAGSPPPVVTLSSVSNVRYSETMTITLVGSNLDQSLTLVSDGCRDFARSAGSTATNLTLTCTVSGKTGAQAVTVSGGGVTAATVPFTVPVPQVTMVIGGAPGGSATLVITLAPDLAPKTVDNFLGYVKRGFYNGTVFHRHGRFPDLSTFVMQGGEFDGPVSSTARFPTAKAVLAPIALERALSHVRYTVGMARLNDPNSATAGFFFNTVDNRAQLDGDGSAANPGYAAFGTVTANTALVDTMAGAPCLLSAINFNQPQSTRPSADCVPEPNLILSGALQTR